MKDKANAHKPECMYATVYGKCKMWKTEPIYRQLLKFIEEEKLTVNGDAYEEYLIGISFSNAEEGCIRIEIPVVRQF